MLNVFRSASVIGLVLVGVAVAQLEPLLLDHHQKGVNSVAFSPSGTTIVTSSDDSTARVWNAVTGEVEMKLTGHTGWVLDAILSANGMAATSDSEGRVALWDVPNKKLLRVWSAHSAWIRALAFNEDGSRLVTASDDKTAKVWDTQTGKLVQTLIGHSSWLTSVFVVQNQVVTASRDGTVRFWNAVSGTNTRTIEIKGWMYNLALSPDGTRFATASQEGVKIWNRINGQEITEVGANRITWSVAFSPDGKTLAVGNDNGTIDIWDAKGQEKQQTLSGHISYIKSLQFSPDSSKLASASRDGVARIWSMK